MLNWGGQQGNNANERIVVPVPSGPALCRLEYAVERFYSGIVMAGYPADQGLRHGVSPPFSVPCGPV